MPASSEKQRRLMAIAEHHPEKLQAKNRGVLKMSHKQLHDFASSSVSSVSKAASKLMERRKRRN